MTTKKITEMKTVKNEKREIVKVEQKGRKTKYKVNFIYETISYIFGKPRKRVKVIEDYLTFYTYEDAKDYAENVEKPSTSKIHGICVFIYPKNYNSLKDNIDFMYKNDRYVAYNSYNYSSYGIVYSSQTLKDFVKYTKEYLAKKETIVTNYNCSNVGMYEVEKLEEKRNDLIDNEIERSEEYIKFLKTLKK